MEIISNYHFRALRNENCDLQRELTKMRLRDQEFKAREAKFQETIDGLMTENAKLATKFSEIQKRLDSEIKARENREAAVILDSQEALTGKEKARYNKNFAFKSELSLKRSVKIMHSNQNEG